MLEGVGSEARHVVGIGLDVEEGPDAAVHVLALPLQEDAEQGYAIYSREEVR